MCAYFYMFKFQSPSKYSPFDVIHILRCFFHCSKQFWTCWFWCLLVLLPFLFHLFHISKMFPFEDFISSEKQKKVTQDKIGWIGRVKHRGLAVFGQKRLNTQFSMGRCTCKSPIVKRANVLSLQKKFTECERSLSQCKKAYIHIYVCFFCLISLPSFI